MAMLGLTNVTENKKFTLWGCLHKVSLPNPSIQGLRLVLALTPGLCFLSLLLLVPPRLCCLVDIIYL